jgi:hypothetical protein
MKKLNLTFVTGCLLFVVGVSYTLSQSGENLPTFKNTYVTGTAPVSGTNCVQTGTLGATITGGTFKLNFAGAVTGAITWVGENHTLLTNIQAALDALPTIGAGNSGVAAGTMTNGAGGTFLISFRGERGTRVEPVITVQNNSLTGSAHTLTFAITTPGVEADCRLCPKGSVVVAADTGYSYINFGIPLSPIWVKDTTAATPTPTATATASPTNTATPTATASATNTPTPTP